MSDLKTPRKTRDSGLRKRTWTPPSLLDAPTPPEGVKYRWVRAELLGQDQSPNVYGRVRQGYEPVYARECADFDADSREDGGKLDGVVRSGDLILMKCDEEVAEQRTEYYRNMNRRSMEAVNNELMRNNSETMPIDNDSKSSTLRGNPNRHVTVDPDEGADT